PAHGGVDPGQGDPGARRRRGEPGPAPGRMAGRGTFATFGRRPRRGAPAFARPGRTAQIPLSSRRVGERTVGAGAATTHGTTDTGAGRPASNGWTGPGPGQEAGVGEEMSRSAKWRPTSAPVSGPASRYQVLRWCTEPK